MTIKCFHYILKSAKKRLLVYRMDFYGTMQYTGIRRKKIHFVFSTKTQFPSISINPKNSVISLFSKMQWAQNATECNVMPYNAEYAALYLKTAGKRLGVSRIDFYGNRRYTGINGILTTEYEASDVYIFPSVWTFLSIRCPTATYSILSNSNSSIFVQVQNT